MAPLPAVGMRAADSGVLVQLVVRDDPLQAAAADRFVSRGASVSLLALAEAVWTLESEFGLGRSRIAQAINMLLNHLDLTWQDADVVAAALEHNRKDSTIGFSDCLVLEIARKNQELA